LIGLLAIQFFPKSIELTLISQKINFLLFYLFLIFDFLYEVDLLIDFGKN